MTTTPVSRGPLAGRTALVTGASRGIGAAIARRLDAAGARVALSARNEVDLKTVAGTLDHEPVVIPADLGQPEAPGTVFAAAVRELGAVDILVNNAGAILGAGPAAALTAAVVDDLFALNVRSALLLSGLAADHMAGRGGGAIVTVSSVLSGVGGPYLALYAATKGALQSATRALASEYGPAGVRVNTVRPGVVDTDMATFLTQDPVASAAYDAQVPLGRIGRPEEIAELVVFLAGPGSSYITAEDILVDGGWGLTRRIA